jgi:hypothetical protein
MSMTPALDAEYRKVIPARFSTRRDGTPLHCMTCGADIVLGQSYTGTNDFRDWHNYCAECSASYVGQIKGLYGRIGQLVADMGTTVPTDVATAMTAVRQPISDLIATPDSKPLFLAAKAACMTARALIGQARKAERAEAMRLKLAGDPTWEGLALATTYCTGKFHDAAESMMAQWLNRGFLTERQKSYAEAIVDRANKLAAKAVSSLDVGIDIPTGLYLTTDGTVRRIYKGGGHLLCRTYNGVTFEREPGGVRKVADGLAAGTARMMTAEEATRYGRQHGRCFSCLSIGRPGKLADDRSLSVGYGPDCADWHGWFYPTAEEAARILRGES